MNNSNILDFENPESVYQFTKSKIDSIIERIEQIKRLQNDEQDAVQNEKASNQLKKIQEEINKSIDEFRDNSEWNKFTISFFGETNAGKSTIIETLRILLGESTKIKQKKKFKEIEANLDLDANKYNLVALELVELDIQSEKLSKDHTFCMADITRKQSIFDDDIQALAKACSTQKELIMSEFDNKIDQLSDKYHELQEIIARKKYEMSWWFKILYILKFVQLDEERKLDELLCKQQSLQDEKNTQFQALDNELQTKLERLKNELEAYIAQKNLEIQECENSIGNINIQKDQLEKWMQSFDEKKNQLQPYADGEIMGDGRSDFTRDSTVYDFEINGYPVGIIDVPGIEGDEKKVEDKITQAVQKTHAVFYVTAKNAAPNEGTLKRIKQYIGDQTEVWTIFNKPIMNPRALFKGINLSDDDKKSLMDMEAKLTEVLGNHYGGTLTVAGLPAFYSQATCLIPSSAHSDHYNRQLKYFNNGFDRSKLFELSKLQSLVDMLKNQIVGDVKEKIKKSNFNKVKVVIDDSIAQLEQSKEFFKDLEQNLRIRVQNANHEIDNYFVTCIGQIKKDRDSLLAKFIHDSRKEIYDNIDRDISNDVFKNKFKIVIEDKADYFEQSLKKSIESRLESLSKNIKSSQRKLQNSVEKLYEDSLEIAQNQGMHFDFDFKFDNGINLTALITTVMSGIIAAFVTKGWSLLVSLAGIAIAIVKSVWSFFDSKYKKAQQKQNSEKNLSKIKDKLTEETNQSIEKLENSLKSQNAEIRKIFNMISLDIQQLNNDLSQAIREFKIISEKISI